jgi:hypothetical protein
MLEMLAMDAGMPLHKISKEQRPLGGLARLSK